MPNGIVNNEEEEIIYNPQVQGGTAKLRGAIDWLGKPREITVPEAQAYSTFPQETPYAGIVHKHARATSDKVVQDLMQQGFEIQPLVGQTSATTTTQTRQQLPEGVSMFSLGAPSHAGDVFARGQISKGTTDLYSGIANQLSNAEMLREEGIQRQRSDEATAGLQLRKDLGLEPQAGVAEYEAGATRMRERSAMEGVVAGLPKKSRAGVIAESLKSRGDIERTRIGAVSEQEKAKSVSQAKIYESAIKSQADWAKLGISADDVRSKQQYRKAQVDDLMTRTGLLEPMKLQLAHAKTGIESRKIQRDFAMQALDKVFAPRLKEYQDSVMSGMPRTPEQQVQFNKLMKDHDNAIANIDNQFPEEGATRKFEDGHVGRFTNGKWVDITEQSRGVVGG